MVAVPPLTPVTTPVDGSTVATAASLLLHVPPPVASLSVLVAVAQKVVVPVIAAGADGVVFTVTLAVVNAVPQLLVTV
jgi:hypothetical protein